MFTLEDILAFAVIAIALIALSLVYPVIALVAGVGAVVFVSLAVRDARREEDRR